MPGDLARSHNPKTMWLNWYELVKVSYHDVKFADHRQSGSGDIMISVCQATLQDHMIKALCDFMIRSSLLQSDSSSCQVG